MTAGGHAGKPRPASASIARHPATSALSASANKPSTHKATSGHTARAPRHSRAQHRRHSGSHTHIPATSNDTAVSQATVNSGANDTPSAASHDSQTNAPVTTLTPQPSPATTTPAAPTHTSSSSSSSTSSSTSSRPKFGQLGVLGPGHSPDS
jgi:hypothetical protein